MRLVKTDNAQFNDKVQAWAEIFAHHTLEVEGVLPFMRFALRKHPGAWMQCIILIDTPDRYFIHGDYDQINGMSVLGYKAQEIFFNQKHNSGYVWDKYLKCLPVIGGKTLRDGGLTAQTMFYAVRSRFLQLWDPESRSIR